MRYASLALALLFCSALAGGSSGADGTPPEGAASPLAGHWRAAETEEEKQRRLQVIDEATRDLNGLVRGKARSRLLQRTSPRQSLVLEIEASRVAISSADRRVELELGGSPLEISGHEGKAMVSASMEGPRLIVVTRSGKGERKAVYHASGARLRVVHTVSGPRLAVPVHYVSTYARADRAVSSDPP